MLALSAVCALVLAAPAGLAQSAPASIQAQSAAFARLVSPSAALQTLADGLTWAEGPVWVREGGYLLFSDVPKNRIYRWTPGGRAEVFLEPSGGAGADLNGLAEPGTNGLKPGRPGFILAADQGGRAISRIELTSKARRFLATRFEGRRFSSPNDLVVGPDGAIWFTDPTYGLKGGDASPLKEQPVNGVYRLAADGAVTRVEAGLSFPNGIAFSPDGRTLYVANSDPKRAIIVAYDVARSGQLSRQRIFADMTPRVAEGRPGLPDGMTVDARGDLWATGPGGVHVFTPAGQELGVISTGAAVANCTFGGLDGRTLFMTSTHAVVAVHTQVRGAPAHAPAAAFSSGS